MGPGEAYFQTGVYISIFQLQGYLDLYKMKNASDVEPFLSYVY